MVQEITAMETPSAQLVAVTFVHQYYTMLNKSPECLHRFYNNSSQFLHGGLDSVGKSAISIQGQQEIHNKVLDMNFRDCHTKIIVVDSQLTLAGGVVIQVTGELSNDGQPLRRFMQTFVLASTSPKQYFIQNDILRYQDEVFFSDDENDFDEVSAEIEGEGAPTEVNDATNTIQEVPISHYYGQHSLNNGTAHSHLEKPPPIMIPATVPAAVLPSSVPLAIPVVHTVVAAAHPVVAPVVAAAATAVTAAPPPPTVPTASPIVAFVQAASPSAPVVTVQQKQQSPIEEPEPIVNNTVSVSASAAAAATTSPPANSSSVLEIQEYMSPSKDHYNTEKAPSKSPELPDNNLTESSTNVRTYATMVSSKSAPLGTSSNSNPSMSASAKVAPGVPSSQSVIRSDRPTDGYSNSLVSLQPQRVMPARSKPMTMRGGGSGNSNYSMNSRDRLSNSRGASEEPVEYERTRPSGPMCPDNQQVFVGNLPLDMNEDELRTVFEKFGTVIDVRIQLKYGPKIGPLGRQTPNYGFVSFDNVTPVKGLVHDKILFCRSNHRLNVEEKKVNRPRPMYGGGADLRANMPRMGGAGGGGNSNRGPPMGGGRGSRGGMMMGGGGGMGRGGNGMSGGGRGGYSSQGPNRDRRQ